MLNCIFVRVSDSTAAVDYVCPTPTETTFSSWDFMHSLDRTTNSCPPEQMRKKALEFLGPMRESNIVANCRAALHLQHWLSLSLTLSSPICASHWWTYENFNLNDFLSISIEKLTVEKEGVICAVLLETI